MIIEFKTRLSNELEEIFRSNEISLDDWDYMLIMDYDEELFNKDNSPKDDYLKDLLRGCCDEKWYKIKIRDKEKIVGVAYHG